MRDAFSSRTEFRSSLMDRTRKRRRCFAGYWIIECESFDRATEIAAELSKCTNPEYASASVIDVRPIAESRNELDL